MIEREFVKQKLKEFQIEETISKNLRNVGHSKTRMQRTPLGEKIIIHASRPGLVVGREGKNIKELTSVLKKKFKLENPQIEILEVENTRADAQIVAENIAQSLERFGTSRFKGVGHKVMAEAISSGVLGIEILISGKVPSSRAKTWRFYQGYLKKCGDVALTGVDTAYSTAYLKSGVVGIQVKIMPADTKLPDKVEITDELQEETEETEEPEKLRKEKESRKNKEESKKKKIKKKASKKKSSKKEKSKSKEIKEKEEKEESKPEEKETKTEEPEKVKNKSNDQIEETTKETKEEK